MITLEQALELAEKYPIRPGTVLVPLKVALGRVLGEDIYADRDEPPFSRAIRDGYACRRKDLPGPLTVIESIPAGKKPTLTIGENQCSQIMTGAMVPEGADCVIMQEYVQTGPENTMQCTTSNTNVNIDFQGQNLKAGDLVLPAGTMLTPEHLGIISSTGKVLVKVTRQLIIGILATGSELVEPAETPEGAQIRNSNSQQLAGQIRRAGHLPKNLGIVEDHAEKLSAKIADSMEQLDLLILTGGVSVGEFDLVPGTLEELGLHLEFQKVAMQPGKPITFAQRGGEACIALSGNPVSSFVQFELLVRPYLESCTGAIPINKQVRLKLEKGYKRKRAGRRFFLPVSITESGNCEPVEYHGSGHLHALAKTIGFAEMQPDQTELSKGDIVHVRLI